MAGLDNIKKFEGGGLTGAETPVETPTEATDTTVIGKAAAQKGPYALPLGGVATGVDPELLANMQKMVAEREAQKNGFMENLKDATAWWSGGMAGPGEALARRSAEREKQDETTFGMKRSISEYKIAEQNAKNMDKALLTN